MAGGGGPGEVEPALPAIRRAAGGLLLGVRVSPNAKRTRLLGRYGDRLKVQVAAPPEKARANGELRAAMAAWLEVPPDYVVLHSGHTARDKVLAIQHLDEDELRKRLARLLQAGGTVRET